MQHTTKTAKSPSAKTNTEKTDGYLLYNNIICRRVSTRLRDTVEGEERRIKAKATKTLNIRLELSIGSVYLLLYSNSQNWGLNKLQKFSPLAKRKKDCWKVTL